MILACIMLVLIATGDSADVKKKKKSKKVTNVQADAPLPIEEKPQAQQSNAYDDYTGNYDDENYKDDTENEYDDNNKRNNNDPNGK